jgi:hypothetical protein
VLITIDADYRMRDRKLQVDNQWQYTIQYEAIVCNNAYRPESPAMTNLWTLSLANKILPERYFLRTSVLSTPLLLLSLELSKLAFRWIQLLRAPCWPATGHPLLQFLSKLSEKLSVTVKFFKNRSVCCPVHKEQNSLSSHSFSFALSPVPSKPSTSTSSPFCTL